MIKNMLTPTLAHYLAVLLCMFGYINTLLRLPMHLFSGRKLNYPFNYCVIEYALYFKAWYNTKVVPSVHMTSLCYSKQYYYSESLYCL